MDHKKYLYLQNQIQEARNALQTWNDRKSEVMIQLDSIFSELEEYKEKMEKERQHSLATIAELKSNLQKNDQEFHKHFEAYTNEMQELKLSNEELNLKNKSLQNESEKLKEELKKKEKENQFKLQQISAHAEIRVADSQLQMKNQLSNLTSEVQMLQNEKRLLIQKSKQYEKELRVIRNQMMNFLNVTQDENEPQVTSPVVVSAKSMNEPEVKEPAVKEMETTETEVKASTIDEPIEKSDAPTSVSEYLKRLGY
jgi:chromosome segregation ATPase